MLLPVMMLDRFRSLHVPALRRQWFGLGCIGLFMVSSVPCQDLSEQQQSSFRRQAAFAYTWLSIASELCRC